MVSLVVFRRWKELGKVRHSKGIDFGCICSRIHWIKFKFTRIKDCVVVGYGPNGGDGEEGGGFWNDSDRTVDRVGNGYRDYACREIRTDGLEKGLW